MRARLVFCLIAGFIHFVFAIAYLDAARAGRMVGAAALGMVASNLVGMFAFYPLIRWRLTARLADQGLVLPQMLCAILSAAAGYALAPSLRPVLLQVLCVIQLFGLFSLRPPQLLFIGATSVSLLTLELVLGAAAALPRFDVARDAPPLLVTLFVLVMLTRITLRQSRKRGQLREQKRELERITAQLDEITSRDALTGLFNRRRMQALIDEESARRQRSGRPYAIALLDLDHFKRINDTHGHARGDAVLTHFATLAPQALRAADAVARWGGEEFLLLMRETGNGPGLCAGLTRLRETLRADTAFGDMATLRVTFSAGVAVVAAGETPDQTLRRADEALYAAKAAGRDRIVVAA